MKKNFFCCIPQQWKAFSIVSHNARNAAALYPTTAKKISASQEDQFDEKKNEGKKSRSTIPVSVLWIPQG
jgi:hypothetical protein